MTLTAPFSKVAVIDDAPNMREELAYRIKEQSLEPVLISGPFKSIDDLIAEILGSAQFALCDLQIKPIINASGSEVVARLTERRFPSILFSQRVDTGIAEFRDILDRIPAFLTRDELDQKDLRNEYADISASLLAEAPEKRAYPTILRVEAVHSDGRVDFIIPGWSPSEIIEMSRRKMPAKVADAIAVGSHVFASVNLGARSQEMLYIKNLELAEEPDDDDGLA